MYSEKSDPTEQLRQTLAKILDWILHGIPEDPKHNCGNPDSGCDALCVDWASFCTDYTAARKLVGETPRDERDAEKVIAFSERYKAELNLDDADYENDYENETPEQREARTKELREKLARYEKILAQLNEERENLTLPDAPPIGSATNPPPHKFENVKLGHVPEPHNGGLSDEQIDKLFQENPASLSAKEYQAAKARSLPQLDSKMTEAEVRRELLADPHTPPEARVLLENTREHVKDILFPVPHMDMAQTNTSYQASRKDFVIPSDPGPAEGIGDGLKHLDEIVEEAEADAQNPQPPEARLEELRENSGNETAKPARDVPKRKNRPQDLGL